MRFLQFSSFLIILSALALPALANNNFVVLELFTTRGCANCPPVDARVKKIVEDSDENLIALGCHVTYFNKPSYFQDEEGKNVVLDFSDPLAQNYCDARQYAYVRSDVAERIYTPQIVINGRFDTQGKTEQTVTSGLSMAQSLKPLEPIQLSVGDKTLDISLPKMRLDKPANIWLFGYNKHFTIQGTPGIKTDQIVEYVNYVAHHEKLLHWDGSYKNMSFPLGDVPAEGYAVIAQYEDFTDIIAAGKIEPPATN